MGRGLSSYITSLSTLAGDLYVNLGDLAALHERTEEGRNARRLDVEACGFDESGGGHGLGADDIEESLADGSLLSLLLSGLLGGSDLADFVGVIQLADGFICEINELGGDVVEVCDGLEEFTVCHNTDLSRYQVATR